MDGLPTGALESRVGHPGRGPLPDNVELAEITSFERCPSSPRALCRNRDGVGNGPHNVDTLGRHRTRGGVCLSTLWNDTERSDGTTPNFRSLKPRPRK